MTDDFQVTFRVPGKLLGDVLTAVRPFKIDGLDLRPVVQRSAPGRAGGVPAVEVVAQAVRAGKAPLRARDIAVALAAAGYSAQGASTHIAAAIKAGRIKRTPKGTYAKGSTT